MDPRHEETNNALSGVQGTLPPLDDAPLPEIVHHYTDTAGLLGMVESGVRWATDYRYLNDSSEIRYTFDLAAQVIADYLQRDDLDALGRAFIEQRNHKMRRHALLPVLLFRGR